MKEKIQKFSQVFISVLSKIVIIGIIGLILFNIGKSIWKNYLVVQKIESENNEITKSENENKNLKNLIIYYQTDTYKELEARRKLGYKKPGENVLIIPELNSLESKPENLSSEEQKKSDEPEQANFLKWYYYIIY